MPYSERLSSTLQQVNEGGIRVAPTQYTPWIDQQAHTIEVDPTVPSAPTATATGVDLAIDLEMTEPTTNTDGSVCRDFDYFEVFYKLSSGIVIEDPGTYSGTFTTSASRHTFPTQSQHYFRVVAWDKYGNRSAGSTEVNATPVVAGMTVSVDDYSQNIANVYTGAGMIGIQFQAPKSTWARFSSWKLYVDTDSGGGFTGSWTLIYQGPGPAFLHKGLNENYKYKYKATVTGEDGTETTGTVQDNSGAGYRPNATDNTALLAVTVFAERMIASKEMIAQTFIGGKLQSANWSTTRGSYYDLDNGTIKLGGSSSPRFQVDSLGNLTCTNATITGQLITSTGSNLSASYVSSGTMSGDRVSAGTITGTTIQTASSGTRVALRAGFMHDLTAFDSGGTAQVQILHAGLFFGTSRTINWASGDTYTGKTEQNLYVKVLVGASTYYLRLYT